MTSRRLRKAAGAAFLTLIVAAPGGGQEPAADWQAMTISTSDLDVAATADLEAGGDALPLSLEDAVAIALERNLGLLIQRYERAQFRLGLDESLGIYDFNIGAEVAASEETSPTSTQLSGAQVLTQESQRATLEGRQLTPWGGVGSVSIDASRFESNSQFVTLNPNYGAGLTFGISQPLLRDFGKLPTERGILVARLNSQISRENFEESAANLIQGVTNAYFNLIEVRGQLEVARESLSLAEELHDMNRVRVDVGTLAPLELVQSEVGIATRQEDIIRIEALVQDAEDTLRRLLNLDEGPLWNTPIRPTTEPALQATDIDLDQAIATALAERPELAAQKMIVETRKIDAAFYRNQKLPRLDLQASYGYSGIGGSGTLPGEDGEPIKVDDDLWDAFGQVTDRDFDGWSVLLSFAYPLQNRTARARSVRADLNLEQGATELAQLEQTIRVEVRAAVRGVRTAAQRYESAQASRGLAERNLEAEQKRYENGLSTSFQVLEIQEDLSAARSREVDALASYRRALAEYFRSIGMILEQANVTIADPIAAEDVNRFGWSVTDPATPQAAPADIESNE